MHIHKFIPSWYDFSHLTALGRCSQWAPAPWQKPSLPLQNLIRCPAPLRFSVLAQHINLLGYSIEDLLPSGLWDTDHKPPGPALQTFLRPTHWPLTQARLVWLPRNTQFSHPTTQGNLQILFLTITHSLSPFAVSSSWDLTHPGDEKLKSKMENKIFQVEWTGKARSSFRLS